MYIDTHCHLNFPQFNEDRAMVIGNAKKAGVKQFINPGVDLYASRQAIELAKTHPGVVFAGVGFHPYEAQHDCPIDKLELLLQKCSNYIVAIGECGLDYHQYKGETAAGKKSNQKRLFSDQLGLAIKYRLPVIMHCREAFAEFFDVLDSLPSIPPGVIHCFSGGLEDIRLARKRKLFIGIDGNVTYSKQLEIIVPHISLTILLLETDAPLLTPLPHRGQRNEPKFLPLIAQKIAQLQGKTVKEIEEASTTNAHSLFQIS